MRLATTAAALIAFLAVAAPAATTAPSVAATSFDQLAKPLPLPYDESADADQAVAAAKARALKAHKRLLVDLGGNWCLDCRILAGTMKLPEIAGFVAAHYEVVTVDIGRFDKNGQIAARYGIKGRLAGVPAVLIVDPRTDRLVDAGHETALSDARHMSPQGLADWLAQWAA
ncbi:thioredoxin family protein [Sphingomonas bacterium]|uniref:thioredoxin family protein n=1 Tax=Sphingomonas bacterium TaxID=1895847 RepID=UPI00157765CD|nr:thioredoxin family protein [Sphingomonas bacterium]